MQKCALGGLVHGGQRVFHVEVGANAEQAVFHPPLACGAGGSKVLPSRNIWPNGLIRRMENASDGS